MRARTRKQGLALAFGKYRYGITRREDRLNASTTEQLRQREAEMRGNTICWNCDGERKDTADNCERCGANSTPF